VRSLTEAAAREVLVRALTEAAAEIAGAEVRVVTDSVVAFDAAERPPVAALPVSGFPLSTAAEDSDLDQVRLRMPESLRMHVEQIAAVEGISVNAWLVRAVTVAVNQQHGPPPAAHGAWSGRPAALLTEPGS
jgi:hypothetical protein